MTRGSGSKYLCGATPYLAEHDLVKVVDALKCLTGAASCFSWPTDGDNAEADMLSFCRIEPQRALHVEAERSSGAGGRERKRKWREAGRQMD
jgi:hypothetical protein